jgi:hypothetical protein
MAISIKDGNGKAWMLLVMLFSCAGAGKTTSSADNAYFLVSSVFDDDRGSITVNDSVYVNNKSIVTDRSLGIDLNIGLKVKAVRRQVRIKASFTGNTVPDDLVGPVMRTVSIDTVIDLRKGRYLLLQARLKEIIIEQYRKKIVVY